MTNNNPTTLQPLFLELAPASDSVTVVTQAAESYFEEAELPMRVSMKLLIAIDEIVTNIYSYSGASMFSVKIECPANSVKMTFRDNGTPFDPSGQKSADITLSAEERQIGGLGILMVKKTMDSFEYRYEDKQNVLTVSKKF